MINKFVSFYNSFEIACFLLLVSCVVYAFRVYGKKLLKQSLQKEEEDFAKLQQEYQVLKVDHQKALQQTNARKAEAKKLLEKLKIWQEKEGVKFEQHKEERSNSQNRVKGYLEDQARWLSLDHAKRDVFPGALVKAQEELKKLFSADEKQKLFLAGTVEKLSQN